MAMMEGEKTNWGKTHVGVFTFKEGRNQRILKKSERDFYWEKDK